MKATDLVIACENTLGFTHDPGKPLYKARAIEAGKINKKLAANPGVTLEDLALALELCRRRREPITSPVALFWRVKEARELANAPRQISDLAAAVEAAIAWEMGAALPDRDEWVGRLVRSHGEHREYVLNEWEAAGRG